MFSAPALQGWAGCLGSARHCALPASPPHPFVLSVRPNFRVMLGFVLGSLLFYHKYGNCTLPWFLQMPKHSYIVVALATDRALLMWGEGSGRGGMGAQVILRVSRPS